MIHLWVDRTFLHLILNWRPWNLKPVIHIMFWNQIPNTNKHVNQSVLYNALSRYNEFGWQKIVTAKKIQTDKGCRNNSKQTKFRLALRLHNIKVFLPGNFQKMNEKKTNWHLYENTCRKKYWAPITKRWYMYILSKIWVQLYVFRGQS